MIERRAFYRRSPHFRTIILTRARLDVRRIAATVGAPAIRGSDVRGRNLVPWPGSMQRRMAGSAPNLANRAACELSSSRSYRGAIAGMPMADIELSTEFIDELIALEDQFRSLIDELRQMPLDERRRAALAEASAAHKRAAALLQFALGTNPTRRR